jgi:hypothetical protein
VDTEAGPEAGLRSASWLLAVAAGAVLLSALALSGGIALHFLGYALASLLAFSAIAMFRRRSLERSAKAGIGIPHWLNVTAVAVLVVGFLVSLAHSWFIASYFS